MSDVPIKLDDDSTCYVDGVPRRKPGPSGPAYPIRPKWQQTVREEMRAQNISQTDLAKTIGCSQAAIASLLRDGAKQSALVPAINKALGLKRPADPSVEVTDPERAELAAILDELSDEDVARLLDTARRFLKSTPGR
jgi:transcriptional regulator with XRE-family HTH domain